MNEIRLLTWNVNKGFQRKSQEAFAADPDIVVLPESPCDFQRKGWIWNWIGANPKSGLGIGVSERLGCSGFRRICANKEWFGMVELNLPEPTVIVGVWACYAGSPRKADKGPVNSSVSEILEAIAGRRAIVAGDFNNGAQWDGAGRADNFRNTVEAFQDAGLVSAYHHFFDEDFGAESAATFYSKRSSDCPHHIDYCFIPEEWRASIRAVEVGAYRDWIALSDHMPLTIDLAD